MVRSIEGKHPRYFEAILQLRDVSEEVIDFVDKINGVDEVTVYMTHSLVAPPHYSVMIDICNLVDDEPSIYSFIITEKKPDYFKVRFSGIIDSENYTLHYFVIGEADPPIDPPIPSGGFPPSGSPSGSPPSGI